MAENIQSSNQTDQSCTAEENDQGSANTPVLDEDDYITLSDILPSHDKQLLATENSDFDDEFSESPKLRQQENVKTNNSLAEVESSQNEQEIRLAGVESSSVKEEIRLTGVESSQEEREIQLADVESSQGAGEINTVEVVSNNNLNMATTDEQESSLLVEARCENSIPLSTSELPKVPRKRGRKPKQPRTDEIKPSKEIIESPPLRSRRVRKPKYLESFQEEISDKLPKKSSKQNDDKNNSVLEIIESNANTKVPEKRKRGRPKKNTAVQKHDLEGIEYLEDEVDNITLSDLKKSFTGTDNPKHDSESKVESREETSGVKKEDDQNVTAPLLSDFEYNLNNVISATNNVVVESMEPGIGNGTVKITELLEKSVENNIHSEESGNAESLLIEDTSKRPTRKRAKCTKYDVDSDEDPFANVELSDDDKPRRKRGTKYYSDDEYVPENVEKKHCKSEEEIDSDFDIIEEEPMKKKGKKTKKPSIGKSPIKKIRPEIKTVTPDISSTVNVDDFEECLETTVIKSNEPFNTNSNKEFENFLAKRMKSSEIQIKKLSTNEQSMNIKAPLEIPVIDLNEATHPVHKEVQTVITETKSAFVQTSTPYSIRMTKNIPLSSEQSENACDFLRSILNTTTELGKLMTEKSDEFVQKKINTTHVKDTMRMDYCIKKAFLLFKLAKDNLSTMEENLEKQYQEFLERNKLDESIETDKKLSAQEKESNGDSDCEIVEVSEDDKVRKTSKSAFQPKTVFLNKELSIKITKKPAPSANSQAKPKSLPKLVKGKNAVWLNESVMMKKVKPTQSFLAQDSRNTKPPDTYVTEDMINNFFRNYNRQNALTICAPYVSPQWLELDKQVEVQCNYYVYTQATECHSEEHSNNSTMENYNNCTDYINNMPIEFMNAGIVQPEEPKSLFFLCSKTLCENINSLQVCATKSLIADIDSPKSLSVLSLQVISKIMSHRKSTSRENCATETVMTLQKLCYKKILTLMHKPLYPDIFYCGNVCLGSTPDQKEDTNKQEQRMCKIDNVESLKLSKEIVQTAHPLKYIAFRKVRSLLSDFRKELNVYSVESLKLIAFEKVQSLMLLNSIENSENYLNPGFPVDFENIQPLILSNSIPNSELFYMQRGNSVKKLTEICFAFVAKHLNPCNQITLENKQSLTLSNIIRDSELFDVQRGNNVKKLTEICFAFVAKYLNPGNPESTINMPTIDNINTLTEEAYLNINSPPYASSDSPDYDEGSQLEEDDYNADDVTNDWETEEYGYTMDDTNQNDIVTRAPEEPLEAFQSIVEIKREIVEDQLDYIDPINIKREPEDHLNEMINIPDNLVPKLETPCAENGAETDSLQTNSYDVQSFESFLLRNKIMHGISNYDEHIYSQSAQRIRRQYDPDSDNENECAAPEFNSLLVPHDSETFNLNCAKGVLMQSTSEDDTNLKQTDKKKKKNKAKKSTNTLKAPNKPNVTVDSKKKSEPEINKKKEAEPNKKKEAELSKKKESDISKKKEEDTSKKLNNKNNIAPNEISVLTRKMRERIQLEEKNNNSSDSETEDTIVNMKTRGTKTKPNNTSNTAISDRNLRSNKDVEDAIQCNSIDSTEQIIEKPLKKKNKVKINDPETNSFTGFSVDQQNEVMNYHKYVTDVYEKILSKKGIDKNIDGLENVIAGKDLGRLSPVLMTDEPAEQLECEPSMPMFQPKNKTTKKNRKTETVVENTSDIKIKQNNEEFTEKGGWKCFTVDFTDKRLHQIPFIPLEKLPETFVDTYMKYQEISVIRKEDAEVDRLANLQSLRRSGKGDKSIERRMRKPGPKSVMSKLYATATSPAESERFDELSPSEDECTNPNDVRPSPVAKPSVDYSIAKNSLMEDNDSDTESAMEPSAQNEAMDSTDNKSLKEKPNKKLNFDDQSKSLVLTADKMMKKELDELHAPVLMDEETAEIPEKKYDPSKSNVSKEKPSTSQRRSKRRRTKSDDSSSEEEKQWVSTKTKLLKRMEKRVLDNTCTDEAKRARLVSEFIVRRDNASSTARQHKRGIGRRSRKKLLEHEKQMQVLSQELYGQLPGKKSTSYSRGRRNIRKVIDKKSLARSTVLANMEEFARKKRLAAKQEKLRQLFGYEEHVNVVVINGEVCLEYDFEENRPVVTIHPYFTKVMKAHQYEGVKFMWDACFESVSAVERSLAAAESGGEGGEGGVGGGGGCILAHCMGLGKTLQVLALLQAALSQPRLCVRRALVVCPLSTVLNWVDEINKWLGPVTSQIKVFELSKLRKTYERAYQLEDWYKGGGIFIMGYELFRSLTTLHPEVDNVRPTIINKIRHALLDPGPDIVICDEGHLLKNDSSLLAVAVSRVKTKRRIILTGTPMQNNLREYYCMVNFIKPNLLGTYSEYSNRFENPIMNGQHRDSSEADIRLMKARTHILHKVLEGCLQRQEASVLYPYLPSKHEYTLFITLSPCQVKLYQHYLDHYAGKNNHKSTNVLKDFHTLQKIWSHPQVLNNYQMKVRAETVESALKAVKLEDELARADLTASEDVKPLETDSEWWLQYMEDGQMLDSLEASSKFVVAFRLLNECVKLNDKVLIFSTSLYTMDTLEYFLKKINHWSLGQEYYRLDGSVPPEVRQKWCKEFNAENNNRTKLFLISTRAGCLGLNMTAANRVIILDTSWNPAHDIQSIFRVYRFGQKKDCYIYRLVAMGTMEQKIYERSVTKQAVACRVVDEQQIDRHYNMAELTELYRFSACGSSAGVVAGVAAAVRDAALQRVAAAVPALHAAREHDSLLRCTDQHLSAAERLDAWAQFQAEHHDPKIQSYGALAVHKDNNPLSADDPPPPGIGPELHAAVKAEASSSAAQEPAKKLRTKSKKNRKTKIKCDIPVKQMEESPEPTANDSNVAPPAPSAPITFIPGSSDTGSSDIMKRITEALTKYQFQHGGGVLDPNEIAKVMTSVMTNINEKAATPTSEVETPKAESPKPEAEESKQTKKKLRPRKNAQVKVTATPSTSSAPDVAPKTYVGRTRRRAAIAAMKYQENMDSDDDTRRDDDGDYQPPNTTPSKADNVAPSNEDTINLPDISLADTVSLPLQDAKPGPKSQKKVLQKTVTQTIPAAPLPESIVLSDDEQQASRQETPIPLHKSLLTNPNFIKIVAHTYLKGNPMLDEDAATLAAEYSTTKALNELELTGKDITSGPIYDIAVQVLGKAVLRKLQNSDHNNKQNTEKDKQSTPTKNHCQSTVVTPKEVQKNVEGPQLLSVKKNLRTSWEEPERAKVNIVLKEPAPQVETQSPVKRARGRPRRVDKQPALTPITPTPAPPVRGIPMIMNNVSRSVVKKLPVKKTISVPELIAKMSKKLKSPQLKASNSVLAPQPLPLEPESIGIDDEPWQPAVSATVPAQSPVVPVGMFQGVHEMCPPMEESILPDDDDIRIINLSPPPPPPPLPVVTRRPGPKSRQAATTLNTALPPTLTTSQSSQQTASNANQKTLINVTEKAPNAKAANSQSAVQPTATISLDSDDEDSPVPQKLSKVSVIAPSAVQQSRISLSVSKNGTPRILNVRTGSPVADPKNPPIQVRMSSNQIELVPDDSPPKPKLGPISARMKLRRQQEKIKSSFDKLDLGAKPIPVSSKCATFDIDVTQNAQLPQRSILTTSVATTTKTSITSTPGQGTASSKSSLSSVPTVSTTTAASISAPAPTKPTSAPIRTAPAPTISAPTATISTSAPTKTYPAPTKTYPAPTKSYPAPTKSYPAPTKPSPAPIKSNPAPTKSTPTSSKTSSLIAKTVASADSIISRRISISSSSGSDRSRSPSPADPLNVLKNVVMISANQYSPQGVTKDTAPGQSVVVKNSTPKPVLTYNNKKALAKVEQGTPTKIVGTSKEIIIKSNTLVKVAAQKPSAAVNKAASNNRIVHITNVPTKRKIVPVDTNALKKMKPIKPKTLEDFNVDDFDDIIELE